MESKRQLQVASQIQRVMSEILQLDGRAFLEGAFVTVSGVKVTPDLLTARVYLSVLQEDKAEKVMVNLKENDRYLRGLLGKQMRNKLRRIPEIHFFQDNTLNEVFEIERLLKEVQPGKDDSEE